MPRFRARTRAKKGDELSHPLQGELAAYEKVGLFARAVIAVIAEKIRSLTPDPDISGVRGDIEDLLDRSVAAEPYMIREPIAEYQAHLVDLSKIDFEKLKSQFEKARKHTETERRH